MRYGKGMWAVVVTALVASLGWGEAAPKGALKVATTVVKATVYREGAQVTRRGKLALGQGDFTVTVGDLPITADPASMRVTLSGPRGSLMHNVQLRTVLGAEVAEKRTRELRRRIREQEDARAVVQDRITARQYELDLLRGSPGNHRKGVDTDKTRDWKNVTEGAEAIAARIHALLDENRKDSVVIRGFDERIGDLNREIALSGSLQKDTTALDIELTTPEAGDVTFAVSYVVREASWRATYDLALDSVAAEPKLDVTLVGEVMQRSGEDWKDTALVVSTERPAFLAAPVPPQQDYRLQYRTRKAYPLAMAADGRSSAAPMAAPEPDETPIRFEGARPVAGEFATRFKVAQPVNIRTGSEYRRVSLLDTSLACHAAVVIAPAGGPNAVLEAATLFTGDQPLVPGTTQLYRDGEYVGTGNLATVLPGEELRVAFGTDPAVRIARKRITTRPERDGWFHFGDPVQRYRWETTLKSGHPGAWSVEVHEQIPQSDDPDIRIVPGDLSAGLMEDDPEKPGLKRWKVNLAPGKSTKIVFEFTVSHKKGKPVPQFG